MGIRYILHHLMNPSLLFFFSVEVCVCGYAELHSVFN